MVYLYLQKNPALGAVFRCQPQAPCYHLWVRVLLERRGAPLAVGPEGHLLAHQDHLVLPFHLPSTQACQPSQRKAVQHQVEGHPEVKAVDRMEVSV